MPKGTLGLGGAPVAPLPEPPKEPDLPYKPPSSKTAESHEPAALDSALAPLSNHRIDLRTLHAPEGWDAKSNAQPRHRLWSAFFGERYAHRIARRNDARELRGAISRAIANATRVESKADSTALHRALTEIFPGIKIEIVDATDLTHGTHSESLQSEKKSTKKSTAAHPEAEAPLPFCILVRDKDGETTLRVCSLPFFNQDFRHDLRIVLRDVCTVVAEMRLQEREKSSSWKHWITQGEKYLWPLIQRYGLPVETKWRNFLVGMWGKRIYQHQARAHVDKLKFVRERERQENKRAISPFVEALGELQEPYELPIPHGNMEFYRGVRCEVHRFMLRLAKVAERHGHTSADLWEAYKKNFLLQLSELDAQPQQEEKKKREFMRGVLVVGIVAQRLVDPDFREIPDEAVRVAFPEEFKKVRRAVQAKLGMTPSETRAFLEKIADDLTRSISLQYGPGNAPKFKVSGRPKSAASRFKKYNNPLRAAKAGRPTGQLEDLEYNDDLGVMLVAVSFADLEALHREAFVEIVRGRLIHVEGEPYKPEIDQYFMDRRLACEYIKLMVPNPHRLGEQTAVEVIRMTREFKDKYFDRGTVGYLGLPHWLKDLRDYYAWIACSELGITIQELQSRGRCRFSLEDPEKSDSVGKNFERIVEMYRQEAISFIRFGAVPSKNLDGATFLTDHFPSGSCALDLIYHRALNLVPQDWEVIEQLPGGERTKIPLDRVLNDEAAYLLVPRDTPIEKDNLEFPRAGETVCSLRGRVKQFQATGDPESLKSALERGNRHLENIFASSTFRFPGNTEMLTYLFEDFGVDSIEELSLGLGIGALDHQKLNAWYVKHFVQYYPIPEGNSLTVYADQAQAKAFVMLNDLVWLNGLRLRSASVKPGGPEREERGECITFEFEPSLSVRVAGVKGGLTLTTDTDGKWKLVAENEQGAEGTSIVRYATRDAPVGCTAADFRSLLRHEGSPELWEAEVESAHESGLRITGMRRVPNECSLNPERIYLLLKSTMSEALQPQLTSSSFAQLPLLLPVEISNPTGIVGLLHDLRNSRIERDSSGSLRSGKELMVSSELTDLSEIFVIAKFLTDRGMNILSMTPYGNGSGGWNLECIVVSDDPRLSAQRSASLNEIGAALVEIMAAFKKKFGRNPVLHVIARGGATP